MTTRSQLSTLAADTGNAPNTSAVQQCEQPTMSTFIANLVENSKQTQRRVPTILTPPSELQELAVGAGWDLEKQSSEGAMYNKLVGQSRLIDISDVLALHDQYRGEARNGLAVLDQEIEMLQGQYQERMNFLHKCRDLLVAEHMRQKGMKAGLLATAQARLETQTEERMEAQAKLDRFKSEAASDMQNARAELEDWKRRSESQAQQLAQEQTSCQLAISRLRTHVTEEEARVRVLAESLAHSDVGSQGSIPRSLLHFPSYRSPKGRTIESRLRRPPSFVRAKIHMRSSSSWRRRKRRWMPSARCTRRSWRGSRRRNERTPREWRMTSPTPTRARMISRHVCRTQSSPRRRRRRPKRSQCPSSQI